MKLLWYMCAVVNFIAAMAELFSGRSAGISMALVLGAWAMARTEE